MFCKQFLWGYLAICGMSVTSAVASEVHELNISNETGSVITEFYSSTSQNDPWGDNFLRHDVIENHVSMAIDLDDGTGRCIFAFKAVFDDGDILVDKHVNICTTETYTYTLY